MMYNESEYNAFKITAISPRSLLVNVPPAFPASTDGTLRMWDIETIKELKVIDLLQEESSVLPRLINFMSLVNGDKWVACFSITHLAFFDLEAGLYLKSFDFQIQQYTDYQHRKHLGDVELVELVDHIIRYISVYIILVCSRCIFNVHW